MFLTDAQLKSEIKRCEYCEEKPCKTACPCNCSPADFIMAAAKGKPSDFKRAAGIILSSNPLGGICGDVCPDYHCMQACSREGFDVPINIPAVQATIIKKAREMGQVPEFEAVGKNGKKVAVIGAGPAGIGAAITLIQYGYQVDVFEENNISGGQVNLIPSERLDKDTLLNDLDFLEKAFGFQVQYGIKIVEIEPYLKDYSAVVVSSGLTEPIKLNIPGDETAIYGFDILKNPDNYDFKGKRIALVGGAIAADMALTAVTRGASHVEMIVLESYLEMPMTKDEKKHLLDMGIHFTNRTRITKIANEGNTLKGIYTKPVMLPPNKKFHPSQIVDEPHSSELYRAFDMLVLAVGNRPGIKITDSTAYFCGDMANGPTTVVEAVAAGKNAALKIHAKLNHESAPQIEKSTKSCHSILG